MQPHLLFAALIQPRTFGALLLLLLGACATTPLPLASQQLPTACTAPRILPALPGYLPIYADRGSGGAFSEVDPAAYANMDRITKGFRDDLRAFFKMTDALAAARKDARPDCALAWLQTWARGAHMLSEPEGSQAEQYQSRYEFKWALQGIATAYALLLKPQATPPQRKEIETWLDQAGARVAAFNIERPGEGKLNNHYYWGGASVMAVSVATGNPRLRMLARQTYEAGIKEIRDDGSLAREMTRKQQALHYHGFSLTPLTLMAELARLDGEDWYSYRADRLPRLAHFIVTALDHPERDLATFGYAQDRQLMSICSDDWGWTHFWAPRLPEAARHAPAPGRCSSRLLGGDLARLVETGAFRPKHSCPHPTTEAVSCPGSS